jgi:hypothetical protein
MGGSLQIISRTMRERRGKRAWTCLLLNLMPHVSLLLPILALCKSVCRTNRPRSHIPREECHSVAECYLDSDPCNTGRMILAWVMRYEVQVRVGMWAANLVRGKCHCTVPHLLQLDGWPLVGVSIGVWERCWDRSRGRGGERRLRAGVMLLFL